MGADKHTKEHIGHYHTTEEFMRDNEYIKTGYRINFKTTRQILRR